MIVFSMLSPQGSRGEKEITTVFSHSEKDAGSKKDQSISFNLFCKNAVPIVDSTVPMTYSLSENHQFFILSQ